jgi:hypothetical protein
MSKMTTNKQELLTGSRVQIDLAGYQTWRDNGGVPADFATCYAQSPLATVMRVADTEVVVETDDKFVIGVPVEFLTW